MDSSSEFASAARTGSPTTWAVTPAGGPLSGPGGSISERMSSMSFFCSSNGITLMPKAITAVLPGAPVCGLTSMTACEKYVGRSFSTALIRAWEGVACEVEKRSGRAIAGQISVFSLRQEGNSPPKPWAASTRPSKSFIHEITSGFVRSAELTVTSTSPETPVARSSWSTSRRAGRLPGTS